MNGHVVRLLAALTLLGITVWLKSMGKKWWVTGIPAIFMVITTLGSLFMIIKPWFSGLFSGGKIFHPVGSTALILAVVSVILISESLFKLNSARTNSLPD